VRETEREREKETEREREKDTETKERGEREARERRDTTGYEPSEKEVDLARPLAVDVPVHEGSPARPFWGLGTFLEPFCGHSSPNS
jgi:hypothetical protein